MHRSSARLVRGCYVCGMDEWIADLPTLIRLAQTGSVSRTARELGVPRSTVSRRLARLEAALGVALAERTTRSFRLTEEGRTLADAARRSLGELRTVGETVARSAGAVRGWLRVCLPPGFGGQMLGRFLVDFRARFPEVRVELTVLEHVPHLLDEDFDLVFAIGPQPDAPWIQFTIGRMAYVAVAAPAYLRDHGEPDAVEALHHHVLLSVRTSPLPADVWPVIGGPALRVDPHFVSSDLAAVVDAARLGVGIALVPFHLVAEDLTDGRLVRVLANDVGRELDILVLYPPERRESPVIRSLLSALTAFGRAQEAELKRTPSSEPQ